ncbi:protein translocase subunit SecD [Patescibacteria group bacterium]|nr:protein translocase subunit SecD [Patescibacteria group bacterium]
MKLLFLLAFFGMALLIAWPGGIKIAYKDRVFWDKSWSIKRGLDLQGGARLTYRADTEGKSDEEISDAMKSLSKNIENRINAFGVTEPVVQTARSGEEHRLIVEMPGVRDVDEAIDTIGKTAVLEFKIISDEGEFIETGLTGEDLKLAKADFNQQTGDAQINIEFKGEGIDKFTKITEENVGKQLATFLDENLLQAANINERIAGGKAVISGQFDIKEAQNTAIQLNAGALPLTVELIEQREVGATLGQESIEKSLYAGFIGIIFVSLFMIFYHRFQGILSTIGLALYLLLMLSLFKLLGVTITMGGIAGLILSIGMTIETDVLVFERIREELRNGKSFEKAVRLGFRNAWPSIRDSNAVSAIIATLLYSAGGTIRGFAVVLVLGIMAGLATTFIGTKILMTAAIRYKVFHKPWLFRLTKEEVS